MSFESLEYVIDFGHFDMGYIRLLEGFICVELCGHLAFGDPIDSPILDACNRNLIVLVYQPFVVIAILTAEVNDFGGAGQACNGYTRLVLVYDRHFNSEKGFQRIVRRRKSRGEFAEDQQYGSIWLWLR